ncbi:MAG TPA: transglycosylase SLT domain-containing protein [Bacteroidia bacterium]|nr:transglycosylase SLT domain-containing protein [Bacteroidia bacterium]
MIKKALTILSSACLLGTAGVFPAVAQQTATCAGTQPGDPIAEMLDSLVTLNNVIRYNNLSEFGDGVTTSSNIPHYSDEIYRQRMSKIITPIPLEYNEQVSKYIDLYAYRKRGLTSRVLGLSNLYFPLFEEILDKEGLPLEFKYLSVVESALNPIAVSRVGATGLWQFMYNTGKLYGLKTTSYYDERRDPVKSTYAACKYFKDMYAIYNDWLLVIAAYNCGAGNVNKAIKRSGGKTNFWEISKYLPAETRGYVPAFIAVAYVMNYSSEHQLFPVAPAYNYFEVDTVSVKRSASLMKISKAIDLPYDVLCYLNPLFKRGIIPDTQEPNIIRLPANKVTAYIDAEPAIFGPETPEQPENLLASAESTSPQAYTYESKRVKKSYYVRSGDNLSRLADNFGCSVNDLKKWNRMSGSFLAKGQKLSYYTTERVKVPVQQELVAAKKDTSTETAAAKTAATTSTESSGKYVYHMVQKGDTLWNIAQRYEGVTVEGIMELNKLHDGKGLKPGMKLKVMQNS